MEQNKIDNFKNLLYFSPHPSLSINDKAGYATHINEVIGAFRELDFNVVELIAGDIYKKQFHHSITDKKPSKLKSGLKSLLPSILWRSLKEVRLILFDRKLSSFLERYYQNNDINFIYERANSLQSSGVKFAKSKNIFHILEVNSPLVEESNLFNNNAESIFRQYSAKVEKFLLDNTSLIVVVSNALKNYYQNKYDINDSKFLVLPNAINLNKFTSSKFSLNSFCHKFDLRDNLVVGFVGSIFPWHGVDILIQAIHNISIKNVKLLVVGSGSMLEELKVMARDLKLQDKVIFTGSVEHSEVYQLINLMDICVMPNSNWYGSPVKIFEYGLLAKPVIAPNYEPLLDVMMHLKTGFLIEPSVENLGMAIETLINDVDLRNNLAMNWHDKVLKEHSWSQNVLVLINKIKMDNIDVNSF